MKTWTHGQFTIEEGKRPDKVVEDREDFYFLVLENNRKSFHYCIWAEKKTLEKIAAATSSDRARVFEALKDKARQRVKEKITARDLENILMRVDSNGEQEVPLDKQDLKVE